MCVCRTTRLVRFLSVATKYCVLIFFFLAKYPSIHCLWFYYIFGLRLVPRSHRNLVLCVPSPNRVGQRSFTTVWWGKESTNTRTLDVIIIAVLIETTTTTTTMIENAELVMQMLEMYQMYKQQVPVELEEYLRYVAKTGNTLFQWTLVKPFIREKILNVIAEFAEQSALADIPPYPNVDPFNYEAMKTMLLERFDTFNGPPFTIQRLCELLSCPRKEYNRVDKFMRAVEKNILVVSTCELRSKREETVVNGVPDQWENGKESDINMDLADKSSVIADANVLNGNETVESLLNELESMKTPETKLDELKVEPKEEDHIVAQITDEIESNVTPEEPKQDTQVLTTDTLQNQITNTTENKNKIDTDVAYETVVDQPKEPNPEISEIQPAEVKEQTIDDVEELKDLSNDISLQNVEPKIEEPIVESDDLVCSEQTSEINPIDTDRIEGSIIHLTPDSDIKAELVVTPSTTTDIQPEILVEKSDENIENMEVHVDSIAKTTEPEINCDSVQEECTEEPEPVENDKQQNNGSTIDVPTTDAISTEMDVEPEKIKNNDISETISVNEETTKTAELDNVCEVPQEQEKNKSTESE